MRGSVGHMKLLFMPESRCTSSAFVYLYPAYVCPFGSIDGSSTFVTTSRTLLDFGISNLDYTS